MECTHCGAQIRRDSSRCEYCGSEREAPHSWKDGGAHPRDDTDSVGAKDSMEERIRQEEAFRIRFRAELERAVLEEAKRNRSAASDASNGAAAGSAAELQPRSRPWSSGLFAAAKRGFAKGTLVVLVVWLLVVLGSILARCAR